MRTRALLITLVLVLGLTPVILWLLGTNLPLLTVHADPDPPRFASTTGTDSICSQAVPCALQTAVTGAADGDTIYAAQGTYIGTGEAVITITKSITLYGGWDGAGSGSVVRDPVSYPTTLDGQNVQRVIYASGNISPTIDGFIVTGGNASYAPTETGYGGGIYSRGATPIIANNIVTNNIAYTSTSSWGRGGGIFIANPSGTAVVTGNQVLSNVANTSNRGLGGGIYVEDAPLAQVVNNVVLSNTASITGGLGDGGGVALLTSSGAAVTGNRVEHNVAQAGLAPGFGSAGGGILCSVSDGVILSGNTVRYNTASVLANGNGGGIGIQTCSGAIVVGNVLQGNISAVETLGGTGRGGGLEASDSHDLVIGTNWILSNTAYYGGGLYLSRDTTFTMTNNILAANYASFQGGGMTFETSSGEPVVGTLLHNTFVANDRGIDDGRIAVHVNQLYVTLILTNNLVYSHTYGVYARSNSTVTLGNTLFYSNSSGDTGGTGIIANTDPITAQNPLLDAGYQLQVGSPAIDAGMDAGVSTDINGDPRIGLPDIGADEGRFFDVYLPLVVRNESAR